MADENGTNSDSMKLAKASLRKEVAAKLATMSSEEIHRQSQVIYKKLSQHPWYRSATRISTYLSMKSEADTCAIMSHAFECGKRVFVPQYGRAGMKMLLVENQEDVDSLPLTKWGIPQPSFKDEREDAIETGGMDLIIAPGVAFTKSGDRLGHGAGYYDKYLTKLKKLHQDDPNNFLRPRVIALALNEQIYERIPVTDFDVVIDEILTADD